jgi:catechol 2,3-dioxygenase-like lactoylglutathione lyase family enzyme
MVRLRLNAVCIDCADAGELADFYVQLFGWNVAAGGGDWVKVADPAGGIELNIQAEDWYEPPVWPEQPGALTKMLHFEVETDDVDAAVAHALAAGAREAEPQPEGRNPATLRVMLDPAGHPFCLWSQ